MSDLARLMLDNSAEMLLLVNPVSLQIVMANAPVVSTLGYPLAQLQGMVITEVESALPDIFYWADVRAGEYLEVQSQEGQYLRADGELLRVSKSIKLLDHEGAPMLLVRSVLTQNELNTEDVLAHTLSQLSGHPGVRRQRHSGARLAWAHCQSGHVWQIHPTRQVFHHGRTIRFSMPATMTHHAQTPQN